MKNRPNIVFLVMDAARADRMSVLGYHRPTTPRMEELARRGVVFEQAISAAAWTIPSHATFFTGLYPSEHRAHHQRIGEGVRPLLAEILKDAGHHTIAIVNNTLLHPDTGLARGFDEFHPIGDDPARMRGSKYGRHLARALGWRDSGAALSNQRVFEALSASPKPFFLFVNYMETHFPFLPPPRFRRQFVRQAVRSWRRFWLAQQFIKGRYWSLLGRDDQQLFSLLSQLYDGELAYLDWRIGQLVEWLDREGLLEETILIITSDHGDNLGDHHLLSHHFCLYDTLVRVPLIITWPDGLPQCERVANQVSSADLTPSLCKALGLPCETPHRPGGPRPPLFEWEALRRSRAQTFSEYVPPFYIQEWARRNPEVDLSKYAHRLWAVREDGRKYIEGSDGRRELYDLRSDSQELQNVVDADAPVSERMAKDLEEWRRALGSQVEAEPHEDHEEDEKVMARLRSLGYI